MPTIGGVTINWDETKPAGGDSLSIGDNQIRSDKTALRAALAAEHNFAAAGGASTGYHAYGSARPFFGAQSAVSSSGSDGRLMQTSDTSRLFGVGSGGTTFVGGSTVISAGSFPGTVPQRHHWVMEFGEGRVTSSAGTTITFPNSGFSGRPFIQLSARRETTEAVVAVLDNVTATTISVLAYGLDSNATSNVSFFWQSIGTRVL